MSGHAAQFASVPAPCRCRIDESRVGVRADELDSGEAARNQRAQESEPGRSILGSDDIEAERLTIALAGCGVWILISDDVLQKAVDHLVAPLRRTKSLTA